MATHISFQFYGISRRQVVSVFFSILFENNHYVFYNCFESHYKSTNITYKNIYMYMYNDLSLDLYVVYKLVRF